MAADLEIVLKNFSRIYLGGIPPIITTDSAFVCILTATEALCGYRYGKEYDVGKMGALFKSFVQDYFPTPYGNQADDLWNFRNKMIHAFSTGRFHLTHHNSQSHLRDLKDDVPADLQSGGFLATPSSSQTLSVTGDMYRPAEGVILNAEDAYSALLSAAQRYFDEVRQLPGLQSILRERIESDSGGAVAIHEIAL